MQFSVEKSETKRKRKKAKILKICDEIIPSFTQTQRIDEIRRIFGWFEENIRKKQIIKKNVVDSHCLMSKTTNERQNRKKNKKEFFFFFLCLYYFALIDRKN